MTTTAEFFNNSYLFGGNAPFVEELYEQYLNDPATIDQEWRQYFDRLQIEGGHSDHDIPRAPIEASFIELAKQPRHIVRVGTVGEDKEMTRKQVAVLNLIQAYRDLGVRQAHLDPLKLFDQIEVPELSPAFYELTDADMAIHFGTTLHSIEDAPLSEIIAVLRQTYCGNIGIEQSYIDNTDIKEWIRARFEGCRSTPNYSAEKKKQILKQVTAAETLERYLHTKYVGQKRFSLEGGESTIALLNHLVQASGKAGVQEMVIGMAHRGRLNVLINTLGKKPRDLFSEFEGRQTIELPSGDVKYHMGFSADIPTEGGPIHLSLAFNPSHLEIVNPVVEGSVRARQQRRGEAGKAQVLPVLIHGDSAFIGLGTNQGTFNLSQTRGYGTGGTVHIVINNQIGFTTSDNRDTRSTLYCTDIAKMVEAPVFHVNGDDPEAVCFVTQAALDYRMKFHKDVVIDIVCYRKLGHNEGDDPSLTQPKMYQRIAEHPGVRHKYAERLITEGVVSEIEAEEMITAYRAALDKGEHVEQTTLTRFPRQFAIDFSPYLGTHWAQPTETTLPQADIIRLTEKFTHLPEGFKAHPTVTRILKARMEMALGTQPTDWGMAETLAYASLVENGYGVRLSGEDTGRGTFSHRHAVWYDQNPEQGGGGAYIPLQHLSEDQARFEAIDSILNEEVVLAFEYGYSAASPEELVIWEAQFGDFANGAQVVIDQFIASGETKWGRLCGLTMILPHGYDGQGPEHSSARVERYLQLCAEHNMQVVMPSEASQMFHVLRRQVLRPQRKPLVIMMSKRLLRLKDAMSPIKNFTTGGFHHVIADPVKLDARKVKRVVVCSGQVYYDLANARAERKIEDIAIVRVEQLYPFPIEELNAELSKYMHAKDIVWTQEEPSNQGAWYQIRHRLEKCTSAKQTLLFAGRPSSASPAVGYMSKHLAQLKAFIDEALTVNK
jgi:2-oxoglutarate dehydrogenase E1 component